MIKVKNSFVKNVYYMLSYAFSALKQSDYKNVATEEFENIHNVFASILATGIGQQLKQGLYREYRGRTENISVARGKIDIQGTIRNQLTRKQVLKCEFDELSENNYLNQILKTTVLLLLRHPNVEQKFRNDLKREMFFFSNVETIEPNSIRWTTIHITRNNSTYRMLIGLCQLILEGMLLTTESGEYRLASFLDEQRIEKLYEKFILEYYKKECPLVTVKAAQIPWILDDGKTEMLPIMQSDIMLFRGANVLIIDAKFYSHITTKKYDNGNYKVHSNNLYQIFTYVKNKEAELKNTNNHSVSGMLLYAATDEAIQPDTSYMMSGNKISVRTINLNCDFKTIKEQLNEIVEDHFGRVACG